MVTQNTKENNNDISCSYDNSRAQEDEISISSSPSPVMYSDKPIIMTNKYGLSKASSIFAKSMVC